MVADVVGIKVRADPVPRVSTRSLTSWLSRILETVSDSVLRIFPFSGSTAWMRESRPLAAVPPAD